MVKNRQKVVKQYSIVGTPQEEAFDCVVRHAADIVNAPTAMLNIAVESGWFWCKAAIGLDRAGQTFRSVLCSHTMSVGELTRVTNNLQPPFARGTAESDKRAFKTYVGIPLHAPSGCCIGTLCVVDTAPRSFSDADCRRLQEVATLAIHLLEQRRGTQQSSSKRNQAQPRRKSRGSKQRKRSSEHDFQALKTSLLANISHEVRTPLTVIIGFAEILESELEAPIAGRASTIKQYGKQLSRTLQATTQLSELESGTYVVRKQEINVVPIVRSVMQSYESDAQCSSVKIVDEVPQQAVYAWADQEALSQVVANVLDNAIKFNKTGGEVHVRVETTKVGQVRIVVNDTGIGISQEALPRIFDAFRQESEGTTRTYEGIGVGLTIAKKLVDQMEGAITVKSEKGEGTRVAVYLPAESP